MRNELQNHAGAVAYYFLLSIIPVILIFIFLFDTFLTSYPQFEREFFDFMSIINDKLNKDFLVKLGLTGAAGGAVGIFGLLNLLWSSRLIINSVQRAFDIIFTYDKLRNPVFKVLLSLILVPGVFLIILFSLLINFFLSQLVGFMVHLFPGSDLAVNIVTMIGKMVPPVLVFLLIFCAYRFLPVKRPKSISAATGAILCLVSLALIKIIFNQFVDIAKMNFVYGAIGTVIVLLIWVYLVSTLFFFFAQYTYVLSNTDLLVLSKVFNKDFETGRRRLEGLFFQNTGHIYDKYARYHDEEQLLFNQGDETGMIYYVKEGKVNIMLRREDGEHKIGEIQKGEIFGEIAYLIGEKRTASAVCEAGTVLLELPPEMFDELLNINRDLSRRVIDTLSKRLKNSTSVSI